MTIVIVSAEHLCCLQEVSMACRPSKSPDMAGELIGIFQTSSHSLDFKLKATAFVIFDFMISSVIFFKGF